MKANEPLYYLILGCAGSGRRQVLADLIEAGLDESDQASVLLSTGEAESPFDRVLPRVSRWESREGAIEAKTDAGSSHVFFVTDGSLNPVEQIEAFKVWLDSRGVQVARVLSVVNCKFAEKNPPLFAWFEACIHFSDVVLLNQREGVENKWLCDFLGHFKKQYFPCLFEPVKDGRVKNPALILEPEARRTSHFFDADQDWIFTNADGEVIDEQEDSGESEEEIEAKPEEDPYFVRDAAGRRAKKIPDIAKYLSAAAKAG